MNRVRAGKLIFRDPVLLCGMVYLLLYFDASGFLRLGLLAAVLHELGHILVYCIQQRHLPVIEVTMTGFCMRTAGERLSPAPAVRACRRRACGQFCPCRGMGGASCASCYHPRQRVLGGKSADGAVHLLPIPPLDGAQMAAYAGALWRQKSESAHNPPETIAKPAHLG